MLDISFMFYDLCLSNHGVRIVDVFEI